MALKARYAFGLSSNVEKAKQENKIDQFDILFLDGDTVPKVGWIDAQGETRIVDTEKVIVVEGDALPETGEQGKIYIFDKSGYIYDGTEFVNLCKPTDVTVLENQVGELEEQMGNKVDAETVETMIKEYTDAAIEVIEF